VKTSRKLKVEKLKAFVRLGLLTFDLQLLHFLMDRMVAARGAKLFQLQAVLILLLVLRRSVVAVFAVTALQCNNLAHRSPSLCHQPPSSACFRALPGADCYHSTE
jgi:hypothetical protein